MARTPDTAARARRLARVALSAWHMTDDAGDSAALLVSELVSNAVRHARGGCVRIIIDRPGDDWVCVSVIDRAPYRLPEMRAAEPDDIGGRGLALVEELSERWGCDLMGGRHPWGKRVWAEMKVTR